MCVFYCFAAAGVQSVILTQDDLVSRECQSLTSSALSANVGTSWEICFFNFKPRSLYETQRWRIYGAAYEVRVN